MKSRPLHLGDRLVLVALASLLLHAAVIALLPDDGVLVEAVYARGLYPLLGPLVAFLPAHLPFSLAAVLLLLLAVWSIAWPARNLFHWRARRLGFRATGERTLAVFIVLAVIGFHSFYLFWGYNYLRPPLETRLGLDATALTVAGRSMVARHMIEAAVAARVDVPPWDPAELDALIDAAIDRAVRELEGRAPPLTSPLKGDLGSGVLALQGTRGVISPWTLEAHVDFGQPAFMLPFTAAHEKAHLAGFARERDANFVAWYALSRAEDPRLRYSGYFGVVGFWLDHDTRLLATALEADFAALREYETGRISRRVQHASLGMYRVYLRANRMPAGLGDYWQVADLIQAWMEQKE